MSSRTIPSTETIEKTEVLLLFIKDAFQAFSYKEGDRSKLMTWAEGLESVIDWTIEGVLDYIHDSQFSRKKEPPSLADVFDNALKAKNRAEAAKTAEDYASIDLEKCSSYIKAYTELSEAEQLENQRHQRKGLEDLAARFYASDPDLCRWTAMKGKRRHFLPEDSPFREDIPFASDDEDLLAYEEDPEE